MLCLIEKIFSRSDVMKLKELNYENLSRRVKNIISAEREGKKLSGTSSVLREAYGVLSKDYRTTDNKRYWSNLFCLSLDARKILADRGISNQRDLRDNLEGNFEFRRFLNMLTSNDRWSILCAGYIEENENLEATSLGSKLTVELVKYGIRTVYDLRDFYTRCGHFNVFGVKGRDEDIQKITDAFCAICPVDEYGMLSEGMKIVSYKGYRYPYTEETCILLESFKNHCEVMDVSYIYCTIANSYYLRGIPFRSLTEGRLDFFLRYVSGQLSVSDSYNLYDLIREMKSISKEDFFNFDKIITVLCRVSHRRVENERVLANIILNIPSIGLIEDMITKGFECSTDEEYHAVAKKNSLTPSLVIKYCSNAGITAEKLDEEIQKFKEVVKDESLLKPRKLLDVLVVYCNCNTDIYKRIADKYGEFKFL